MATQSPPLVGELVCLQCGDPRCGGVERERRHAGPHSPEDVHRRTTGAGDQIVGIAQRDAVVFELIGTPAFPPGWFNPEAHERK